MGHAAVIALIDGEHHPRAVRDALDRVAERRELAGVLFCGGEEKVGSEVLERPADHYGRPVLVAPAPEAGLRRLAAETSAGAVVDLADEPVLGAASRLELAALALHLGLSYEAPGARLDPPEYTEVSFDGPKLAVIGTGKRCGKTAVAGHWAALLRDQGADPVVVCMGRGGPAEPQVAERDTGLDELLALADAGGHAASDYLEGAVLAGVRTVGCRRIGGGLAGEPAESNVVEGAALAASLRPGALVFEGSGACIPPVAVDRTVCIVGPGPADPFAEYRLLRSDLVLVADRAGPPPFEGRTLRFALRAEPAGEIGEAARVALFTTGPARPDGLEPVVVSESLARRSALERDLERAVAEGCDVYLTELKAAAIDTVARRARAEGARLVFLRNRPVGLDGDLDVELVNLYADAG